MYGIFGIYKRQRAMRLSSHAYNLGNLMRLLELGHRVRTQNSKKFSVMSGLNRAYTVIFAKICPGGTYIKIPLVLNAVNIDQ